MTIEQRVAVLEEIFSKLQNYYMSDYSGEEIDALLASAGVPIGITKEYDSVSAMNDDFSSTDVTRGQFVLILTTDTSSEDYGKVYLKGSANWVYVFTLTSLTAIKGPQGPAGKRGAKGADGADGKNFMVLGYYETLSALNAAVPSPEDGNTYGIGTEPPYAYYMYDPTISTWRYVGNLQGPAGSQGEKGDKGDKGDTGATGPQGPEGPVGGASNFVRYDAAQTLTDAQKAQARSNIGAAPSRFGLGENLTTGPLMQVLTEETLDTTYNNGWYFANGVNIAGFSQATIRVDSSGRTIYQTAYVAQKDGYVLRRCLVDTIGSPPETSFGPWEWVNPPMNLGVEYRTTERYLGKPVYAQLVNLGAAPSPGTSKFINISNAIYISLEGTLDYGSYRQVLPFFMADGTLESRITNSGDAIVAQFRGTTDYSSQNLHVLAKYIKSTD